MPCVGRVAREADPLQADHCSSCSFIALFTKRTGDIIKTKVHQAHGQSTGGHAHSNHSVGDTCIQFYQYIIFTWSSVLQLGTAALLQVLRSLVEVLDQLSDGEIKHNLLEVSVVSLRWLGGEIGHNLHPLILLEFSQQTRRGRSWPRARPGQSR